MCVERCGVLLLGGNSWSKRSRGGQFPEFARSSALGFGREQHRDSGRVKLISEIPEFPVWRCVESGGKLCLPEPACSIVAVLAFLLSGGGRLIPWIQVLTWLLFLWRNPGDSDLCVGNGIRGNHTWQMAELFCTIRRYPNLWLYLQVC